LVRDLNWISGKPDLSKTYSGVIRYNGKENKVRLWEVGNGKILAKFEEPQRAVASGQILVFYDGDICLGDGVIV
jgi:tRNA-specific 2-thiouridylase